MIAAPMEIGVSLVSLNKVTIANLEQLGCLTKRRISLAPSHFGLHETKNSKQQNFDFVYELESSHVQVTSLQGLLFGLSTDNPSFLSEVEVRAGKLLEIAAVLKVETLVLGAPDVRRINKLWTESVRIFSEVTKGADVELALETICGPLCSEELGSSLGTFSWADEGGAVALDLSNVSECEFHEPVSISAAFPVPIVHLSGRNHTAEGIEEMARVFFEISRTIPERPNPTRFIWEFFTPDVDSLNQSIEESERIIRNIEMNQ